jgi:hypothetical protein
MAGTLPTRICCSYLGGPTALVENGSLRLLIDSTFDAAREAKRSSNSWQARTRWSRGSTSISSPSSWPKACHPAPPETPGTAQSCFYREGRATGPDRRTIWPGWTLAVVVAVEAPELLVGDVPEFFRRFR